MFEYLLLRGIQLVLNSLGHVGMEAVVYPDYAITYFTLTVIPDLCKQVLQCLTVTLHARVMT
jgi:ABC-type microcin C transport system permease subunit YejB